ncbi:hypothetical protein Asn12ST33_09150 [Cutibacterium acnes]|nr:hypothetical protein Asn12ST33_09150 [Cutibacterium acnes]
MMMGFDHLGGARLRYYEIIHARSPYEPRICSITRSSRVSSETLGRFRMGRSGKRRRPSRNEGRRNDRGIPAISHLP